MQESSRAGGRKGTPEKKPKSTKVPVLDLSKVPQGYDSNNDYYFDSGSNAEPVAAVASGKGNTKLVAQPYQMKQPTHFKDPHANKYSNNALALFDQADALDTSPRAYEDNLVKEESLKFDDSNLLDDKDLESL